MRVLRTEVFFEVRKAEVLQQAVLRGEYGGVRQRPCEFVLEVREHERDEVFVVLREDDTGGRMDGAEAGHGGRGELFCGGMPEFCEGGAAQ